MKRFLSDVRMFWKDNKWYENIVAAIYFIGCVGAIPFMIFVNLTEQDIAWRIVSIVMIILFSVLWGVSIFALIADYCDWW